MSLDLLADTQSSFEAALLRPEGGDADHPWAFVVLPKKVSEKLPRRGRLSVACVLNGFEFVQLLEPDGQKSHWLKIEISLLEKLGLSFGDVARFQIAALAQEPEPLVPDDLNHALRAQQEAYAVWQSTTNLAKVDWIHWIVTAKQTKTRAKRIADACEMLSQGKKRVCCFDPSGFYSKAFKAPKPYNVKD